MTEMLSALALADAVHAGRLTPAAVAERCAEAIAAHEGDVAAFAALDLPRLHAAAQDPALAQRALAGLPVGVKDIIDTHDFATEYGSVIYAGRRPCADATAVSLLRRAGGLIAGKTHTTEFAFLRPTPTRNPRRLSHTPGGSSAGSAAAVAAGMLPLALGTQTAGSTIRPASFCGVAGYKPSFRLIPTVGTKVFSWSLDTLGLFAAHVADAAFAASAMTGRDLMLGHEIAAPHFALVHTARAGEASPDAQAALEAAARAAERAGAKVTTLALPDAVEAGDTAHGVIQYYEAALACADDWDRHRAAMSPQLGDYLDAARTVTPDAYDAARRKARQARHASADLFGAFDAVLTFSAPGEAPAGYATTGQAIFNRLWTLLGSPCINVPGLRGATGLPIGVQVVGRFGRDRAALEAARFLERAIADA
ncbi:MAG TPA: amidase [Xanthobacteraceae bacterium]|nr:amidase [Xanthobacteraceae bacterium]